MTEPEWIDTPAQPCARCGTTVPPGWLNPRYLDDPRLCIPCWERCHAEPAAWDQWLAAGERVRHTLGLHDVPELNCPQCPLPAAPPSVGDGAWMLPLNPTRRAAMLACWPT